MALSNQLGQQLVQHFEFPTTFDETVKGVVLALGDHFIEEVGVHAYFPGIHIVTISVVFHPPKRVVVFEIVPVHGQLQVGQRDVECLLYFVRQP